MGSLTALDLPRYLEKWGVPYVLRNGWDVTSRSSGGFESMLGVICHHDAIGPQVVDTYRSSMKAPYGNRVDGPVGNGSLYHDGVFHFWCARAANTSGKGGPMRSSRGAIPLDSANSRTFSIEARNNGVGEPWTPEQVNNYPRLVAAVLDWANNETPGVPLTAADVHSHHEWTPPRKIDPAGPSPWGSINRSGTWDMDLFRLDVHALLATGGGDNPEPEPAPPAPAPVQEDEDMIMIAPGTSGLWAITPGFEKFPIWPEDADAMVAAGTGKHVDLRADTVDRIPAVGHEVIDSPS